MITVHPANKDLLENLCSDFRTPPPYLHDYLNPEFYA